MGFVIERVSILEEPSAARLDMGEEPYQLAVIEVRHVDNATSWFLVLV